MRITLSVILAAGVLSAAAATPAGVFAQNAAQNTQALVERVQALLGQVQDLQNQINRREAEKQRAVAEISTLLSTLKQGDAGEKVKTLQALLAADPSVYPEARITGFYGRLTAEAVKRLQKRHGIEAAGVVGPKTLKKLNELLEKYPVAIEAAVTSVSSSSQNQGGGRLCAIVPPGHVIAPGWLRKHEAPLVPLCQTLPPGIAKKRGASPTSTIDTVAPVISAVSATSTSSSTATVVWTTDELSTSRVYYGTIFPISTSTAASVASSALVTAHAVPLAGLVASTTYFYVAQSEDASGNGAALATSSQQFTL